jgi:hypothetical protein
MNDLRSRTAAMLDGLSDEQLVLVQDYARYLRDRLAWGEPEIESGSASSLASVSGRRDDDHALQALLEGA